MLERINDNTHKIDLLSEYNVSATFIVSDLSPLTMDVDSRKNLFQEGENDTSSRGQFGHSNNEGKIRILSWSWVLSQG